MSLPKPLLKSVCLVLSLQLSHIPATMASSSELGMISTSSVVMELDRAQAEQKVRDYISRDDVKSALLKQGVAPDEVTSRIASLSETELKQLAGQIEEARAGGDILITILIVVLIIYLIKKM